MKTIKILTLAVLTVLSITSCNKDNIEPETEVQENNNNLNVILNDGESELVLRENKQISNYYDNGELVLTDTTYKYQDSLINHFIDNGLYDWYGNIYDYYISNDKDSLYVNFNNGNGFIGQEIIKWNDDEFITRSTGAGNETINSFKIIKDMY